MRDVEGSIGCRTACAALLAALSLSLWVTNDAVAANACVAKNGVGGAGIPIENASAGTRPLAETGAGGTGYTSGGTSGGTDTAPETGAGGTGRLPGAMGPISETGAGGTGKTAKPGTRLADGVGVVGTITGFASICIDDLEVHYTPTIQVESNGLPGSIADLAVGQVVTIEAAGDRAEADELSGARVHILHAVAGPVSSIDPTTRRLVVLGQTVRVTPQTLIADATGIKTFGFLQPGALIRVSGLRLANGDVVASRIETALNLSQATVVGPVTQSDADGFSIYGLRIAYADVTGASTTGGGEVMVSGRVDGISMRAERIALAPSLNFTQRVDRLVREGYIVKVSDTAITVGGVSVALTAATGVNGGSNADLQVNRRVQITGRLLADRSMVADAVRLRRDPLAPPPAASLFPAPKAKSVAFNKPEAPVIPAATPTGIGSTVAGGSGNGPASSGAGGNTGNGAGSTGSGVSGGGSASGGGGGIVTPGGGGVITPGGGTGSGTKPSVPGARPGVPSSPFRFDTLEMRLPGMPHRNAH